MAAIPDTGWQRTSHCLVSCSAAGAGRRRSLPSSVLMRETSPGINNSGRHRVGELVREREREGEIMMGEQWKA